MAVFGYGRVSTIEQTSENQRLEIQQAGYQIESDYWFADEGVSGKTAAAERPQFKALLQQIRRGETLVVSKLDRLGRDALDIGMTMRLLADKGVRVIVLQLGQVDFASHIGKAMLTMLSAVAELERGLLIERTQAGLARAKAQGRTLGRKPKTTPEQRDAIRASHTTGAAVSQLAREYGVSRASILSIVKSGL